MDKAQTHNKQTAALLTVVVDLIALVDEQGFQAEKYFLFQNKIVLELSVCIYEQFQQVQIVLGQFACLLCPYYFVEMASEQVGKLILLPCYCRIRLDLCETQAKRVQSLNEVAHELSDCVRCCAEQGQLDPILVEHFFAAFNNEQWQIDMQII
jgi:hypothetical protein